MAGIGFRLKRLIADETYGGWLRAHIYGAVVSSGPWLLSVFTLAALALLSRDILQDRALDVFRSTVIYCYTFSLITTGGVQMVVTRHVADALYLGDESALAGAFRWTTGATALAHLLLAGLFFGLAPELGLLERIAAVLLFVVVGCIWIAMIFLGAAQDYASVMRAFFVGSALSLGGALLLGTLRGAGGYLAGFVAGQAAIFFWLAARIEREFPRAVRPEGRFLLRSFRRYADLALAGLFYNAAIAADRIIFWASPVGVPVGSWFYASLYDTPLFLAYLSVVPSLSFFLVSIETEFYDRYRQYYGVVTKHGTLRQVLEAKRVMGAVLRDSLRRLLLLQAPLTLLLMIAAPWVAAAMGMSRIQVGILRAALVGAALHALALFGIIVLLYFDRRRAAVEVTLLFLAGNVLLTLATLVLGPGFYGFGYPLAALLACGLAYWRLEATFDDLEYLTFASQPMSPDPDFATPR